MADRTLRAATTLVITATALALSPVSLAHATWPGTNGVLTFAVRPGPGACGGIFTVQPAGSAKRNLTGNCDQMPSDPKWAPSGTKVVFASQPTASSSPQLATVAATGGSPTMLNVGVSPAQDPAYNAAGTVLAFTGGGDGHNGSDIYTVPSGGGTPTNLTNVTSGDTNADPDFSPAASRIAWAHRSGNTWDVWTMTVDANGQNPSAIANLSNGSGNSQWSSWSPDGTKIAFASDRTGNYEIYVMNADGTGVTQVTHEAGVPHIQPAWSPDGRILAFTRGCDDDECFEPPDANPPPSGDIYTVDVSDPSTPGAPVAVVATSSFEFHPQWAPACASSACPAASTLARTATLAPLRWLVARGRLLVPSGAAVCYNHVPVVLELENTYDRGPNWHRSGHWLKIRSGYTSATGTFVFHLPWSLTGWYRVRVPAVRTGTSDCAATTSPVRVNNFVRDRRGDSHGRIDEVWAYVGYSNGIIRHTVIAAHAFSTYALGHPCIIIGPLKGSVGCVPGKVDTRSGGKQPLTIKRPNKRTIVYAFKATELGSKYPHYGWVAWSHGDGDCNLWDMIPSDYNICTQPQPWDIPIFYINRPPWHQ